MPGAVYIVDDDPDFLRGIERLLRAHGLNVIAFSSVEDFQEYANPDRAACVILDVHMGHVSGIDLMGMLFSSGCKAPVILVTANDSEHVRHAALSGGASAFLQKPIPAKELLGALRSIAGSALRGIDDKQT
ncbi:MAG: response regulator [Rhizobiaceae bacterium]|nr:response regulator [Rhizobiaceae bacterium]